MKFFLVTVAISGDIGGVEIMDSDVELEVWMYLGLGNCVSL